MATLFLHNTIDRYKFNEQKKNRYTFIKIIINIIIHSAGDLHNDAYTQG